MRLRNKAVYLANQITSLYTEIQDLEKVRTWSRQEHLKANENATAYAAIIQVTDLALCAKKRKFWKLIRLLKVEISAPDPEGQKGNRGPR
jgi:hypothetical protein